MTNDPSTPSRRHFMKWLGGGAVGAAAIAGTALASGTAEASTQPRTAADRLQRAERGPGSMRGVQRGPISREQRSGQSAARPAGNAGRAER